MTTKIKTSESVNVKFKSVTKKFVSKSTQREFYAVNDISLELESGKLVTLLGPSGCGKTTTLRMLAGFEMPTTGSIYIGDQDITQTLPNKRNVGMMFQSYVFFPHLTVYENVAYGLEIQNIPKTERKERVENVLELMHLEDMKDHAPSLLSGGQQQRVALARAVVTEPKVLLFDEPLSNLDAKLREYMRDELRKIQQRIGITSLYVTHDQTEAMAISDEVVIMNNGKIEQIDTPLEIYTRPNSLFVADFMGNTNLLDANIKELDDKFITLFMFGEKIRVNKENMVGTFKKGDQVNCLIRPENFQVSRSGQFAGKIIEKTYLGPSVEYKITLHGHSVRIVDYLHHLNGIYQVGEDMRFNLNTEFIRVLQLKNSELGKGESN